MEIFHKVRIYMGTGKMINIRLKSKCIRIHYIAIIIAIRNHKKLIHYKPDKLEEISTEEEMIG